LLKKFYEKYKKFIIAACVVIVFFWVIKPLLFKPKQTLIPPRGVQTALAVKKNMPVTIESFGNLTALNNVNISPQVSGQIKEVSFNEGDKVAKGALLFTIDPAPYDADLAKAKASLAQDQADLQFKRDLMMRNEQLVKKDLISKQDFEKCQTDVQSAEAKIDLNRAQVDTAQINLAYCYIKSPIDGITGKRLVDIGNIVSANSGTVLVNVKTIDPLYIDFTISERDIDRVRSVVGTESLKVKINPEESRKSFDGALQFIDNSVNNSTGTLLLRASVANKESALWAGEFVSVVLFIGERKGVVTVPAEAVQTGKNGPYSLVINKDNAVELRLVKTSDKFEGNITIDSGLEENERVVTQGHLGLSPGMKVIVLEDTKI